MSMTTEEKIAVMRAQVTGREIEFKHQSDNNDQWKWVNNPGWNWVVCDYRVKQEPREFSVAVDANGYPVGVGLYVDGAVIPVSRVTANIIRVREVL